MDRLLWLCFGVSVVVTMVFAAMGVPRVRVGAGGGLLLLVAIYSLRK